jgi:hypothetical protein
MYAYMPHVIMHIKYITLLRHIQLLYTHVCNMLYTQVNNTMVRNFLVDLKLTLFSGYSEINTVWGNLMDNQAIWLN